MLATITLGPASLLPFTNTYMQLNSRIDLISLIISIYYLCVCVCVCINHSVVSDSLWPQGLLCLWNSPGKNTGVSSHSLLQGIFLAQESNPGLLHCRQTLAFEPRGKPIYYLLGSKKLQTYCWYLFFSHLMCPKHYQVLSTVIFLKISKLLHMVTFFFNCHQNLLCLSLYHISCR